MSEKWFKNLIILSVFGLVIGAWGMFQRLALWSSGHELRLLCALGSVGGL